MNSNNVIVDSCIFISIYDENDSEHSRSIEVMNNENRKNSNLWITDHILDEVTTLLLKKGLKKQLSRFITYIDDELINLFQPSNPLQSKIIRSKTLTRMVNQGSSKASYTDLYSIVVAEDGYLEKCKILTFDHHLRNVTKVCIPK